MVARFALLLLMVVAACSEAPDDSMIAEADRPYVPRLTQGQIDAAQVLLNNEQKVAAVEFEPNADAELWKIGIHTDGTDQRGYAEYTCLLLSEAGVFDPRLTYVELYPAAAPGDLVPTDMTSGQLAQLRCGAV